MLLISSLSTETDNRDSSHPGQRSSVLFLVDLHDGSQVFLAARNHITNQHRAVVFHSLNQRKNNNNLLNSMLSTVYLPRWIALPILKKSNTDFSGAPKHLFPSVSWLGRSFGWSAGNANIWRSTRRRSVGLLGLVLTNGTLSHWTFLIIYL